MRVRHLQTRFILAGSLLAMTTLGCGFWSSWTLARLSSVIERTLHDSQATIDLATALADSLEREDDALLLALSGDEAGAHRTLAQERRRGDLDDQQLRSRLLADGDDGATAIADLERKMSEYRAAASALMEGSARPDSLRLYHERVNPLLRRAVRVCGAIRERHFASMRRVGVNARDEARAALGIVIAASLAALVLATAISFWLARSVVVPVRALSSSVEALRLGDFEQRVSLALEDELGRLADGFNRMAETLARYRQSSLGELIAAKTTLESTLNALPDAVFVIDHDGAFAALNPPAQAILQATGVVDARRLDDLALAPVHRVTVETALAGRAVVPSRADFSQVFRARLDGQPRQFLVTAVPIPEFVPRRTGAVIVFDDVTEFARLDELRAELVAVASHELKTPLTTLQMNLMLLGEATESLTARQRELLAATLLACEELASTTDELLDVARIESGQLRLDLVPVDLNAILDSALRLLRTRIDDAEVRLEVRREARPAIVRGDPIRLRNVMTNLLANALNYSPRRGRVIVEIVSRQNAAEDGMTALQFAVTDAGPGVPEPYRERIFGKFFRVEDHVGGVPEGVRGTGIGLYLCREVVKAHGGSIWCEPAASGPGAVVAFQLDSPGIQ
jgi:two-component system, NtrC family, sensor histidine kinase KinB